MANDNHHNQHKFCVAPMLDLTDKNCRYFLRLISKHAYLYSEMTITNAILKGNAEYLLSFNPQEQPLALQLGGSNPDDLAKCVQIAQNKGFDEVNLNVGCPSDRIQMQEMGACLMLKPQLVAKCLKAMQNAADIDITIKHRIGIDVKHPNYNELADFVGICNETGCQTFIIHARTAYLQGLSPKDNRTIPPLNYDTVYQLKKDFPQLKIIINGGISKIDECLQHLKYVDGVMLGRGAYHNPYMLAEVDSKIYGINNKIPTRLQIMQNLREYLVHHLKNGGKINQVTRHILGLALGLPNARKFRHILSMQTDNLNNFDKATELLQNY